MIKLTLTENEQKPFEIAMNNEMANTIVHFDRELIKLRTGRAHTSSIEDIPVICYGGSPMPLKSIASLAAPEVRLLTIQPWDTSILDEIEKAILNSDLGLTPHNDGNIIRLQLPEMSTSRREELLKVLGKKLEECKVAIRNVRKEFHNFIRDAKKDKSISENFFNRLNDTLQKITDTFIEKADQMSKKKVEELTTI